MTIETIESSRVDRGAATIGPAKLSFWRRIVAATSRRIAKGQAARLAKVERALRPGRIDR
jgi:hypothetical protein